MHLTRLSLTATVLTVLAPFAACSTNEEASKEEAVGSAQAALGPGDIAKGQLGILSNLWARGYVSGNGLNPAVLLGSPALTSLSSLVGQRLNSANVVATGILDAADGPTLLEYTVKCALPQGTSLVVQKPGGGTLEISGEMGLMPTWPTRSLSTSNKRWLSACLLAHANGYAQGINILVTGNHPALLASTAPFESLFTFDFQEAAFYGDLFATHGSGPWLFACTGYNPQHDCGSPAEAAAALTQRMCQGSGSCGFAVVGPCHDDLDNEGNVYDACDHYGSGYEDCGPSLQLRNGSFTATYDEVLTAHIMKEDLAARGLSVCED